jgi:hypothetical protein
VSIEQEEMHSFLMLHGNLEERLTFSWVFTQDGHCGEGCWVRAAQGH